MPTSNFAATGLAVVESITQVDQLPESEVNAVVDDDFGPTFEEQLENEMDDAGGTSVETLPPLTNSTCPPPPSGKGIRPADYLSYKGKWLHKASICRLLFNEGFTAKSHDRLLRVHGFTPMNKSSEVSFPSALESSFIVGNPFVTLLCLNDHTTALALIHSTSIQENGVSCDNINLRTLHLNSSKVKVTGNVLTLLSCTWKPVESEAQSKLAWVWNGAYLKTDSPVLVLFPFCHPSCCFVSPPLPNTTAQFM